MAMHDSRIHPLNDLPVNASGEFVLYWMQQAQRAADNHALAYAVTQANAMGLPVLAVFGVTDAYPEANLRHYAFMLEGLAETQRTLAKQGIALLVRHMPQGQTPAHAALALAGQASLIVTDCGYLRHQRDWRDQLADDATCRGMEVETDLVVPVDTASEKEEYAARTIRPKLHRLLETYLLPIESPAAKRKSIDARGRIQLSPRALGKRDAGAGVDGDSNAGSNTGSDADLNSGRELDLSDIDAALRSLTIGRDVAPSGIYRGGASQAMDRLEHFLSADLNRYVESRNQPALDCVSHMSPYLHFGQISPLTIALAVQQKRGVTREAKDAYLEELIVRRELAYNFVWFNDQYDRYDCLPDWAQRTLKKHAADERETVYSPAEFEQSQTHDPYWNAAQREMVVTGFMHNYMRMYWGKKIIEWTAGPREAFDLMLYLNNRYELDGRDANSYAGVAWCFGKHDRPWGERAIFGSVRYMNAKGLERKCDIKAYVQKVAKLEG